MIGKVRPAGDISEVGNGRCLEVRQVVDVSDVGEARSG